MIICNDIMAYMFGFFFGKTPLIKLSPKKTWEGFIGGAFATVVFGLCVSILMYNLNLQFVFYEFNRWKGEGKWKTVNKKMTRIWNRKLDIQHENNNILDIFQLSYVLLQFDYFVCPINYDELQEQLSMECERAPVFRLAEYTLPQFMMNTLSLVSILTEM